MAGRYTGPHRKAGDADASPALRALGKQLLGKLQNQAELSGVKTQVTTGKLPDGSSVTARLVNGQPQLHFTPPTKQNEGVEETILAYFSSTSGLRIFDLGTKKLVKTITGLHSFDVDNASDDGAIVHMTGGGLAVRVNLPELSAFSATYTVAAAPIDLPQYPGRAMVNGGLISPDQTLFLINFEVTANITTGVTVDGLGGHVLANATTLVAVRSAIRMTFRQVRAETTVWAPDSERFFIATSLNTDPGDIPSEDVATSDKDYLSTFDRNGVLLNSLLIKTWNITPSTAFNRSIRAIAINPQGTRLYLSVRNVSGDPGSASDSFLKVLNIEDPVPVLMASIAVTGYATELRVNRAGTRLFSVMSTGTVKEYDIENDANTLTYTATNNRFPSNVVGGGNIKNGLQSKVGAPDDSRQFYLTKNVTYPATLFAWRGFDKPHRYDFDISSYTVRERYALVHGGIRTKKDPQ